MKEKHSFKLPEKERLRIQTRHRVAIENFGYQPKALFWKDASVQQKRFQVLSEIILYLPKLTIPVKVLDIGCGFGDLYPFLQQQTAAGHFPEFDYLGIDVAPAMVESAGFQYPGIKVQQGELSDFDFTENQFDLVMLSGALNEPFDGAEPYAKQVIQQAYRIARLGFAFNLLDNRCEEVAKSYNLQGYAPEEMVDFCQGFAERVGPVHGYLPNDFTLYLM